MLTEYRGMQRPLLCTRFMPILTFKILPGKGLKKLGEITNTSLVEEAFTRLLKEAVITPLLTNLSLPRDEVTNYRPVFNLPFLSKGYNIWWQTRDNLPC